MAIYREDWAENGVDARGRQELGIDSYHVKTRHVRYGIARLAFGPAQERLKRRERGCFMLVC